MKTEFSTQAITPAFLETDAPLMPGLALGFSSREQWNTVHKPTSGNQARGPPKQNWQAQQTHKETAFVDLKKRIFTKSWTRWYDAHHRMYLELNANATWK